MEITGELRVVGAGAATDGSYVRFQLSDLETAELAVHGYPISLPSDAMTELQEAEAIAEVSRKGRVRALYFDSTTPLYVRQLLRPVVMELQAVVKTGAESWSVVQEGFSGRAVVVYDYEGNSDEIHTVRRKTEAYRSLRLGGPETLTGETSIAGGFIIQLHYAGYLLSLNGKETVTVEDEESSARAEVRFELDLIGISDLEPKRIGDEALAKYARIEPGEIPGEAEAKADALRNRVGGYTFRRLEADLLAFGNAGEMPDHRRWFHRTVGMLILRPELAVDLAEMYFRDGLNSAAQNLIADILANAGTPEAQAALRRVLADPRAQADKNFGRAVQSMTILQEPEVESVRFLGELSRNVADPTGRASATISFGAGIGKLVESGDLDEAQEFNKALQELAIDPAPGEETIGVLYALGNTGLDDNLPVVEPFLGSADVSTRATAARALRKMQSEAARTQLRSMAVDESAVVQREAFRAMQDRKLSSDDLAFIIKSVEDRTIHRDALPAVLRGVLHFLQPGVDPSGLIAALRERAAADDELLARVNELALALKSRSKQ